MKQNSMAARTVGRLRTSIRRIRWRIEGSAFVSRLKRLWDNFREPPVEQWLKTMKQSEALISKRDMEGLIRFVKQWRHSVKIVGILSTQMAAAELFRTPEEAADAKMTELMDALHKTRFMARYRRSPQYHDPQQNDCIRGMLAMHDYLLNAARDRYPQRNYRWMHPSELRETEYILDRVFRQRTCTELLRFILERKRPSPYIALRYGWEKDVDRLDTLYREAMCADISRIHDLRKEIQQIEAPMERRAESILERLYEGMPPSAYLEKVERELQRLDWLSQFPEKAEPRYTSRYYLLKYDIRPEASRAERIWKIERAAQRIETHLARMTGRMPRTDKTFIFVEAKRIPRSAEKSLRRTPSRNARPQKRGRKH